MVVKKYFLKTVAFFVASVSILGLGVFSSPAITVHARPNPEIKNTIKIPLDTKNITLYMYYGDPNGDVDRPNAVATLVVRNAVTATADPAIMLTRANSFDIFNGDPNDADTVATPAGPLLNKCDANFSAPKYEIPSRFFTDYQMTKYGIQTAKNSATETGFLKRKRTGCMAFSMKVSPTAKVGDKVNIDFDWDAGPSTALIEELRPAIVQTPIEIVAAANLSVSNTVTSSSSSSVSSVRSSSSSSSCASSSTTLTNPSNSFRSSSSSSRMTTTMNSDRGFNFFEIGGVKVHADGVVTSNPCPPLTRSGGMDILPVVGVISGLFVAAAAFWYVNRKQTMGVNVEGKM